MKHLTRSVLISIVVLITGSSFLWEVRLSAAQASLRILYPYQNAFFPRDFAPPTFRWDDSSSSTEWQITTEFQDGGAAVIATTRKPEWKPAAHEWETIKERSMERNCTVTIHGRKNAAINALSGASITIRTSKHAVEAPIFYRDVPLPASLAIRKLKTIVWRLGEVSSDRLPPAVLTDLPVCGNCHSFSSDGKYFAMDVDFGNDKGAYVISEMKREIILDEDSLISWSDYRREDGERTFGLMSQISPDGRYVISTVKDFSIFKLYREVENSQLFFPVRGILVVYDRSTKKFSSLPGADDPKYVQSNPIWSPDGKWIVFARADAIREEDVKEKIPVFYDREETYRYDLYRIPFNAGRGGEAVPLPGASGNAKSNYFPKYSPDGRWIVFCQADSFMLNQPDSRLFIMPAEGGTPRRMISNSENGMNSWHSWSPDSRWLAFSSKATSPYTQLWLTHIDQEGVDSPPVLLENFVLPDRAVNIPEFVNIPAGTSLTITDKLHH